jgi:osmotically-inducible protein OsmY
LQKAEAQDIASRVKGLVSISNRLKVEPDISITYYDWPINPADDWIYGNQSSHKIPGEFGQQPYLSDEQIKKNIEDGFFWNPYVERDAIKVTVDGGVAVLTGTVGTWIGMGEINKDAYNSGATKVVNRVKIDKGAWLWE